MTDRGTDGRAVAYTRCSIYAVERKNHNTICVNDTGPTNEAKTLAVHVTLLLYVFSNDDAGKIR